MSTAAPASVAPIAITQSNGLPLIFRSNSYFRPEVAIVKVDGSTSTIDLGASMNLAEGEYLAAFDVQQSADFRIFIVIATRYLTASKGSRLFVFRPFRLQDIDISSAYSIKVLIIPQTEQIPGTVQKVLIDPNVSPDQYPNIVLSLVVANDPLTSNLLRVNVPNHLAGWTLNDKIQLPTNAEKILDFTPGTVDRETGVFCLYTTNARTELLFKGYSVPTATRLGCSPDIARIFSTVDSEGKTELLAIGKEAWHFTSSKLVQADSSGTKVANFKAGDNLQSLQAIYNFHSPDKIEGIWKLDQSGLSYTHTLDNIDATGMAEFTFNEENISSFAVVRCSSPQTVICFTTNGQLKTLQQSAVGAWSMNSTPAQVKVGIQSIILKKPHSYLREVYEKRNPNWRPEDLILWSADSAETANPACAAMNRSNTIELVVMVQQHPGIGYYEWILQGKLASTSKVTFLSEKLEFPSEEGLHAVEVLVTGWSKSVPWGIQERVEWSLISNSSNGREPLTLSSTPLELYAVVDDLAPIYRKEGIPLELLRIMLLPTVQRNIMAHGDWIASVVRRCHASKFDTKTADVAIHNYRYDVWSGAPRFANYSGDTFGMDAWLSWYKAEDKYMVLNCYDQAALVQAVAHLGVPYHFVDARGRRVPDKTGEALQNVGRIFKDPFGFIKSLDLVGWGDCDNPFFRGDTARQLVRGKPLDPENPRSSFGNHAFVYIRVAEDPFRYRALDACAGPTAEFTTIQYYLEGAIDLDATRSWNNYTAQKRLEFSPSTGLESFSVMPVLNWSHPPVTWSQQDWTKLGLADTFAKIQAMTLKETVDPKSLPVAVPINDMLGVVASGVRYFHSSAVYGPLDVQMHPIDVGDAGAHVSYDIWLQKSDEGQKPPFITLRVDILDTCEDAIKSANAYLATTVYDQQAPFEEPAPEDRAGFIHIVGRNGSPFNLFVFGNLVVQISGTLLATEARAIAKQLDGFISSYPTTSIRKVDFNQIKVLFPPEVTYNVPFTVTVLGANVVYATDISFENQNIRETQDPIRDPYITGKWTIPCIARKQKAEEIMVLAFAEKTTFVTSTRRYPITIT